MLQDRNLAFLKFADNEDLKTLADYIIELEGKSLSSLFSEKLSDDPHYPNHLRGATDLIISKLQKYSASNFGKSVEYSDILKDVCKVMKCNYSEMLSIEENEMHLVEYILLMNLSESELSAEQLADISTSLRIDHGIFESDLIKNIQSAIRSGGISQFDVSTIVANAASKSFLGRGLVLGALLVPVVFIPLNTIVSIFRISRAYEVTIPAVIQIAYMRQKFNNEVYKYKRNRTI